MFVNAEVLSRGLKPDPLFVFIHCQRTGGSNFERWLHKVFPAEETYDKKHPSFVQWQKLGSLAALDKYRLFSGFSDYKEPTSARPVLFLGIARHPFYRIASLKNLAKKKTDHFLHDLAQVDLETFYTEGRQRRPWYFDNLQTRRLAGQIDAYKAIEAIRRDFGLVATTDFLSSASEVLKDFFGWTVAPLPPLDAPPDAERYAAQAKLPIYDKICQDNDADMKVFEFVSNETQPRKATINPALSIPAEEIRGERFEQADREYFEYKKTNPDVSYAAFMMGRVARRVAEGAGHNSLGANLVRPSGQKEEFWDAGRPKAEKYMKRFAVKSNERVCEYGCGSLRIGAHFIKYLEPGNFYGVDVTDAFYEMGKGLIGNEIIAAKTPHLGVIAPAEIDKVAAFQPDFTYSSAVCCHVHPDELGLYFANLQKIANKPGARVIADVHYSDAPVRYQHRSWAMPMSVFESAMPELEVVKIHGQRENPRNGFNVGQAIMEWRRPKG
jgi:hypothetical protein